jgi:hypothetical protein
MRSVSVGGAPSRHVDEYDNTRHHICGPRRCNTREQYIAVAFVVVVGFVVVFTDRSAVNDDDGPLPRQRASGGDAR